MTTEATKPQAESSATRAMPVIAMAVTVLAAIAVMQLGTESAKRAEQLRIYQDQQAQKIGSLERDVFALGQKSKQLTEAVQESEKRRELLNDELQATTRQVTAITFKLQGYK